ncbi:hypothetical protein EBB07_20690 [Paenibacillaceae bacterium]|nr:hypothetical protein EBB07_20690 [Paenibacillaceae bacterium]
MGESLIIKHAVGGRVFIDTGKSPLPYQLVRSDSGWTMEVHTSPAAIAELLKWRDELNVFLFHTVSGQPNKKIWFYVQEGAVRYDEKSEILYLSGESAIEYDTEAFGFQS